MVIKCPNCGAENPDGAEFCDLCLSTFGFESPEFPVAEETDEGYLKKYPSSFSSDASTPPTEEQQEAPPVEIGEYGVRSGHKIEPTGDVSETAKPVDIGEYGVSGGAPIYPGSGEDWMAYGQLEPANEPRQKRGRLSNFKKTITRTIRKIIH
ncbi:MAG: zinc ribbon domain-containing protein [Actinomycetota bacterium]|nr:zinc ribbon domain-containing protein [Actinomycetota bacterium]